jgi:hypothetical protein
MRQLTIILLFIILFSFGGKSQTDTTNDSKINFYLNEFKAKTLSDKDKKELKMLLWGVQNKGFRLEEGAHDYKGALVQINKALQLWIEIADTASEANLRKYKGYLLGHLNEFPEAKTEIHRAIDLYRSLNMDFGVAVSQFDLSKVYELEPKLDSAKYFAQTALTYWKTQADTGRILDNVNELINIHNKLGEYSKSEKIQKESQPLLMAKDLIGPEITDFYFLSCQLYEKLKNSDMANKYKKLYSDRSEALKKKGSSYYKSTFDTQ